MNLLNKTALVTGASSGIGQAIAIALAAAGAHVLINYCKNEAGARQTLTAIQNAGGAGKLLQADMADPAQIATLFRTPVDILVNNAADPIAAQPIEHWTPEQLDRVFQINLRSVILCAQAAIPGMKEKGWGRIINISSIGAAAGGSLNTLPYAAAKGGVETFTRGLAHTLGESGITVNAVAPGSIATGMQTKFVSAEYIQQRAAESALKRTGLPEEVAAAVVFLASPQASYITGQILRADGGRRA